MTDSVTPTLGEFVTDYERCGAYLRRKDATPSNPSELYTADDILSFACTWTQELCQKISNLENQIANDKLSVETANRVHSDYTVAVARWNHRLDELQKSNTDRALQVGVLQSKLAVLEDCGESQTEDCCGECLACKDVSFADAIKQLSEAKAAMKDIATHLRVISSEWGFPYWWQNNPSGIAAIEFINKYYQGKRE